MLHGHEALPLPQKMSYTKTIHLVIDLGNTDLKFAYYDEELLFSGRGKDGLKQSLKAQSYDCALISSVAEEADLEEVISWIPKALILNPALKIPIKNKYATPKTLGQDRLANAVAIAHLSKGRAALSIDCGTCLKFDFVDEFGAYKGGSISPGLHMRFKALNHFTANLPLIDAWESEELIGNDTKSSLVSGVLNGMRSEINETIARYLLHNQNLTIYLTGGDASHFENAIKYPIFADSNLTLFGLKLILEANV
jgi:type III pantothenate kinase